MSAYGRDGSPGGKAPYTTTSHQHSTGAHRQPTATMGIYIPGRQKPEEPPPPLPPPRFPEPGLPDVEMSGSSVADGQLPRWQQWTRERSFGRSKDSSLAEEHFPMSWKVSPNDDRAPVQPDFPRRQSDHAPVRSPRHQRHSHLALRIDDEGYYSMPAGSASTNAQLRGEQQLHHRGQEKSSQAYDNKLLSKIGKPKTPPGPGSVASPESSPTSSLTFGKQPLPQSRSLSFPNSITSAYSDSPIKTEPGLRSAESPWSRPVSPGTFSSGAGGRNFTEYRSPTFDRSTRSSTMESDTYSPYHQRFPSSTSNTALPSQQLSRRSIGQSSLSNVDESAPLGSFKNTTSLTTRPVKQENYDHSIFSEPEFTTFRMEESVDQLHLDDRALPPIHPDSAPRYSAHSNHQLQSQRSMGGTKRKTPPMASEGSHDTTQPSLQQMAGAASHFAQNAPSHLSPGFPQHHGSVSSQSSAGFRNGSYASSGGPSVAGSSYTSLDQTSPGGISPSDQQNQYQQHLNQDAQYSQSLSMDPNPRAGPYPDPHQQPLDPTYTDAKPTPPRKEARKNNNAPQNLSTTSFLCGCCLKKPRKFDTLEEKIQHEAEKQYRCAYCTNRFKNKNEAERHQNSLHLRRQSWSCAELAHNYAAAFFPASDLPNQNIIPGQTEPVPAANDICGYCGKEFTNEPNPDWETRMHHLETDHKFRECNQSKKFFRADHFRQHLKHSHAGTSGKWTNRLEQACIKDEPPATPLDQQNLNGDNTPTQSAPVANMGGGGSSSSSVNQQQQQDPTQPQQSQTTPINHQNTAVSTQQHPNYSPHPSNLMAAQQNIAQMDMTNIDPSIGIQQLSSIVTPVGDMGGVVSAPSQRQHHQQAQMQATGGGAGGGTGGGGTYDDLKSDQL